MTSNSSNSPSEIAALVRRMEGLGLNPQQIADATGLPLREVVRILEQRRGWM
jgi:hypothetical protein